MARQNSTNALLVMVALVLVSSAHAQLDQCVEYFNGLGGATGVMQKVPSCSQGMVSMRQCCQEAKALAAGGPGKCLCDPQVWAFAVKTAEDAQMDGVNSDTLNMFANLCGIPHYGGSGC